MTPTASAITAIFSSSLLALLFLRQLKVSAAAKAADEDIARQPTSQSMYVSRGILPPDPTAGARGLYLDLVRRTVSNLIYEDRPAYVVTPEQTYRIVSSFDLDARLEGRDQPTDALTMVGWKRLEQLQAAIEQVLLDKVPGDLIELGVMRGGAAVLMRAVLKSQDCQDRKVYACDTFDYIPPSAAISKSIWLPAVAKVLSLIPGKQWRRHLTKTIFRWFQKSFPDSANPCDELIDNTLWFMQHPETVPQLRGTSDEHVRSGFARFGLLDDQVVLLKGFFSDTIPNASLNKLSVIRVDADTYESTTDALRLTYSRLSPGGYCIIDDYGYFSECKRAVDEFRAAHGIDEPIEKIDRYGVFWRKRM
jgi:hypothetical protein